MYGFWCYHETVLTDSRYLLVGSNGHYLVQRNLNMDLDDERALICMPYHGSATNYIPNHRDLGMQT